MFRKIANSGTGFRKNKKCRFPAGKRHFRLNWGEDFSLLEVT
jgi:hypothetical protein